MPKRNIKEWVFPGILLLAIVFSVSFIITKNQKELCDKLLEGMSNPPVISVNNLSIEKAKLLLPYLKAYMLSNYPTRKSVTSDDDKKITLTWEDLSGNKNDIVWTSKPKLNEDSKFITKGNILKCKSVNFIDYEKTNEFTIIIKSQSLDKSKTPDEINTKIDIGEIIANADLSNKKNLSDMTLNVPVVIKEDFEDLKLDLLSGNQNPDTLTKMLMKAGNIKNLLETQPNKGKKIARSPVAIVLQDIGNKKSSAKPLEIRVPSGSNGLEIDINGVRVKNSFKSSLSLPEEACYTITYKLQGDVGILKAYINSTKVVDEKVAKINIQDKELVFNPSGNLNVGLSQMGILNRVLNDKEIQYFLRSDVILRTLIDENEKNFTESVSKESVGKESVGKENVGKESVGKPLSQNSLENSERSGNQINQNLRCPPVTRDDKNNYLVNNVSYGNNRRVAREIYRINHNECKKVPRELDDWYNKKSKISKSCPFRVNSQFNPCKFYACENVNWEAKNVDESKMKNKCRRRVDAYCEEHAYLDPFCKCWRSEFYDLPECVKFRSKFNNPRDRGCSAADFPIEENPDFDKYIRKDRIPCFGCNISD